MDDRLFWIDWMVGCENIHSNDFIPVMIIFNRKFFQPLNRRQNEL
jgi:hypothetical protein